MKTKTGIFSVRTGFVAVVLLAAASSTFGLPPDPDNAAVIYYQAFLLCKQPDEAISKSLDDFIKGSAEPSEQVERYIETSRTAIDYALMAAQRANCNWGLMYSKGYSASLPHLAQCRLLSKLIIADARLLAAKGAYREALDRSLIVKRLARHVGDDTVISFLVATAINTLANDCIRDVLGMSPPDLQVLEWLRGQLAPASALQPSFARGLRLEQEMALQMMHMDRRDELVAAMSADEGSKNSELAAKVDEPFLAKNREYYQRYMTAMQAMLAAPTTYVQKYSELRKLLDGMTQEAGKNTDAVLTGVLAPALSAVYSRDVKAQAHANALRAAVELYIVRARTGALPANLPPDTPTDPFSGRQFAYEKTNTGFVLRCQGKDLDKDTTYEYAFTVK